ncbi:hypothetical protein [Streptomyces niveus]|uniref:hypothetical protein n=1 Tax=Streptomyces niveus TaxID=193462 RepID=UPI00114CDE2B|nr:hypothetical protein [Streptomyces niveus]
MDPGIAAVFGAAVGVVGSTLAAAVAGFSAQRQVRSEHTHWRRQLRRDAYTAFIAKADEVHRLLAGIEAELISPEVHFELVRDEIDRVKATLQEDLAAAQATVEIEGPEKLARTAEELTRSLSACIAAMRARTIGRESGNPISQLDAQRVRRFLNHALTKRKRFVEQARTAIDV